jgi:glycosyltransferase involved in cell wall biosynthesis
MLSIIIPSFNAEKTLGPLLGSIGRSDFKDYEVIVVDDCSSDNTEAVFKCYPVKSIKLPVNSGSAAARNKGAELAQGDILVFFDADIEIEPDTLGKIAGSFEKNPDIKVLVGTYSDEPVNKGDFPRFKALWFASLFDSKAVYTDSLEGFCTAIHKEVFKEVGGFNPFFKNSSAEDYELGCRLRRKYKIHFAADIKVRHNFPGFFKNAACFFRRAYDFMPFFLGQERQHRGSTFNRDGLASICALLSFTVLPFIFLGFTAAKILFLLLFAAFVLVGSKFIKLAFVKEGAFFGISAVAIYYINSIILGIAIVLGLSRYYSMPKNDSTYIS